MKIKRNGTEYELTQEELQEANEERRKAVIRAAVAEYFEAECAIGVPDGAIDQVTECVIAQMEADDQLYLSYRIPWQVNGYLYDNDLLEDLL